MFKQLIFFANEIKDWHLLFQHFLEKWTPLGDLRGTIQELMELWESLLDYLGERPEELKWSSFLGEGLSLSCMETGETEQVLGSRPELLQW